VFARSTTIMGNPEALDLGIEYVRDDVMPAILLMDGCVGLSMLVDRDTGQCIVTSSWHSEEAMRASDLNLRPMREQAGEIMLGGQPQVEEWEVAAMHRDHMSQEGACCRVTWMRTNETDVERGIEIYRQSLLPMIEAMPGFCSASLMVNRGTQRVCSTTTFDSREAMEESRDQGWAIRDAGVREAGVDVLDVAEYELCLAHLRVPELV
jgi:heme-degrading monooxygenase HmoA